MLPKLKNDMFNFVERSYNLRSNYTLERKQDCTVYHSSESLSSLFPKLWNILSNPLKNSASLKECKTKSFEQLPTFLQNV